MGSAATAFELNATAASIRAAAQKDKNIFFIYSPFSSFKKPGGSLNRFPPVFNPYPENRASQKNFANNRNSCKLPSGFFGKNGKKKNAERKMETRVPSGDAGHGLNENRRLVVFYTRSDPVFFFQVLLSDSGYGDFSAISGADLLLQQSKFLRPVFHFFRFLHYFSGGLSGRRRLSFMASISAD
jgi:hypothetical protein